MEELSKKYGYLMPVMMVIMIAMAFALGAMWSKVKFLESGSNKPTTTTQTGNQPAAPKVTIKEIKDLWSKNIIKFGDANRKLLLVEVADPSCPYCHVAAGKNPELNKKMGTQFVLAADGGTYVAPEPEMRKLVESGKASMAYIYSPGHGNGEMGMKAMYCANEKGKFWDVHALLFSSAGYDELNNTIKNDKAKSGDLAEFLKSAMNASDMKNCLDSGKYDQRLTEDITLANGIGVQGTPGFYVNSKMFGGAYSYTDMKPDIEAALK
jgi:protein-disulfide isomerase